jgi:hypothetical protein
LIIFSGVVERRFCGGFRENVVAGDGIFVVNLWWNAW